MIGVYNALTNDLRRPLVYEIEVGYPRTLRLKRLILIVLVKLISEFDAINYLLSDKSDNSEIFEHKLSMDVSRIEKSSSNSSMM